MSVTAAAGFRAAGVAAGLKGGRALDVALLVNDGPRHHAAAVFTANRCRANSVLWSEQAVKDGVARAVVVNSGGANCYTGPAGLQTTHATAERVAERLGIRAGDVLVCSTGLIGVPVDRDLLLAGVDRVVQDLGPDPGGTAARAIMTTDSVPKQTSVAGAGFTVAGMAKGAGMLAPAMATMLAFLTTDADVDAAACDRALRAATRVTFDRLDSDGCMSTNDTVALLASGASGVTPAYDDFAAAVRAVCHDLVMRLLADAEGAHHQIGIEVVNAAGEDDAVAVARSVARSSLVKCAVFGRDPNWGRILAAIGTTDAAFDPADLDVALNGVWVCRRSAPAEPPTRVDLEPREVAVTVDLKAGTAQATVWTNDLTTAYVEHNSAYSS
ncbi:MAG: bifunctional glutamate N-acetyltransferase/amino-acid acetyltransferase ArgJ [Actinomycetota bacterium]|nr:bifunctional glutamate N-acetyltransferase/amino-acid acetyltransferase ArgJ [Actinomycetota bacterium]